MATSREEEMGYYMLQWSYKDKQYQAMVDKPQDREKLVAKAVESFGGKLHSFFFAFGDFDGVGIMEFPDNESATAFLLTIGGGGAVSKLMTTVLMTPAEAKKAMKKAQGTKSGYQPPSG
ncbi:MAG TPA: GYD domain-containing protein [Candidatus Nitrosotalea sp.]|jgi:uncharacterized protein with GYD domain|nr:GYD domain-containing protein [Candidatus Nitrosotalea sp.]